MKKYEAETRIRRGALFTALPLSLVSLFFIGGQRVKASAGSVSFFEGTNASCITVLGETPVKMKNVRVSFCVPSCGNAEFGENSPSFTAEYTLFNPSAQDETVSLAYPYELVGHGYGQKNAQEWNREENCIIRSGDKDVAYGLRYTYKSRESEFDVSSGAVKLQSSSDADGFFSQELPVYQYTYRISVTGEQETFVKLYLAGTAHTKIMREKNCLTALVENGYRCLGYDVTGSREITYYSIGGECEIVCFKSDLPEAAPETELIKKTPSNFAEFADAFRPEDFLSKDDWLRASIDFFNDTEYKGVLPSLSYGSDCAYVRWYLYDVTVPAGGTAQHSVSAPLYPASSPYANRFCCNLSPLTAFPSFGEIDVEIETPYYMTYSSLDFTKDGNVYKFSRGELPFGDLSFVLSETDKGDFVGRAGGGFGFMELLIVVLSVAVAAALIATGVLLVRNKHARQRSEQMEKRARMGRPEEGKIDDSPVQSEKKE